MLRRGLEGSSSINPGGLQDRLQGRKEEEAFAAEGVVRGGGGLPGWRE